jgi:hypothetical protein
MATTFRFETWEGKVLNTTHFQKGQKIRISGHTDPIVFGSLTGGHVLISLIAPNGEFFSMTYECAINLFGNWWYDLTLPMVDADLVVHIGAGPDIIGVTIDVSQTATIGAGSSGTVDPDPDPKPSGSSAKVWIILGLIALSAIVLLVVLAKKKGASVSLGSKSLKVGGKA